MNNTRRALTGLAAFVLTCGLASANALTESFTTTTPVVGQQTDLTGGLTFQQFNPSLGTLESVELDFSGSLTTQLTITNIDTSSSSSGSAQTVLQVGLNDCTPVLSVASNIASPGCSGDLNANVPEFVIDSNPVAYSLAQGGSTTTGVLTKGGAPSDEVYTASAVLAEFTEGSGTYTLPYATFTNTLLGNTGGNTTASQVTDLSLTGTVIYTYSTSAPEPTTLFLMGTALLGVGLIRKRAKS